MFFACLALLFTPVASDASDKTYQDQQRPFEYPTDWGGLTLLRVTFINCNNNQASRFPAGGAVYFASTLGRPGDYLNCTNCTFDRCSSKNGYGAAVMCNSNENTFVFNDCIVKNMDPENSVIHMQCADQQVPNDYGPLTLKGNVFQDISIKVTSYIAEGGGSGLVIRFPTQLELIGCQFIRCHTASALGGGGVMFRPRSDNIQNLLFEECVFSETSAAQNGGAIMLVGSCDHLEIVGCEFTGKKGVQKGKGGFIKLDKAMYFRINETKFHNSDAAEGGCIYADMRDHEARSFIVEGCSISEAEATTGQFAIYIMTAIAQFKGLSMKDMKGGRGMIQLTDLGFSNKLLTFESCTFDNINTKKLFFFRSLKGNPALVLRMCTFQNVVSTASLLDCRNDGSGGATSQISSVTISHCVFKGCSYQSAIINSPERNDQQVNGLTCTIEETNFDDLSISDEGHALILGGFTSIVITNCHFVAQGTTVTTVLKLGNSYKDGLKAVLSGVTFDHCTVTSNILSLTTQWLLDMTHCEFVSCTTTGSDLISCRSSKLSQCTFDQCVASQNILNIQATGFTFEYITMTGINNPGNSNLIALTSGKATLQHCVISQVICGTALTAGSATIDNLTITSSEFSKFVYQSSAGMEMSRCHFNGCTGTIVKSTGGDLVVTGCEFVNLVEKSESIITVASGSISISGSTFNGYSRSSSPLISIGSVSRVSLSDCSFCGATNQTGPAYITCTESLSFDFQIPLCFDLSEQDSVHFEGATPLDNLTAQYDIFECENCGATSTAEFSESFPTEDVFTVSFTSGPPDPQNSGGLGAGAIAGIVIAVLIIVAAVIVLAILFLRRGRGQSEEGSDHDGEMNEESHTSTITTTNSGLEDTWMPKITEDIAMFTNNAVVSADFENVFEEAFC